MRPRQLIAFICTLMAGAALYTLMHQPLIDAVAQLRIAVQQSNPDTWKIPADSGSQLPVLPGLIICGFIALAASLRVSLRRRA